MMAVSQATALSGLLHQSRRLHASAHNVANIQTDGYQASRVVGEERADGGVTSRLIPIHDPPHLRMDDIELRTGSNTDPAAEAVTQISARAAYDANLATLETSQEAEEALLDILA